MTPDQFKKAELIQKQINNYKGILNMLHDASNNLKDRIDITFKGSGFSISEHLIHEFMNAIQRSINKLETEFNEL